MKLSLATSSSRAVRSAATLRSSGFIWICTLMVVPFVTGCGAVSLGKYKGIERTASDEAFYLLKEFHLSAGSSQTAKENFDHVTNDAVNLVFMLRNEKAVYVTESRWYDPNDQEYRTIRVTYDRAEEGKKGITRAKEGTTRVHTIGTKELFDHKPGLWKVALYIDGQLTRRQNFFVR